MKAYWSEGSERPVDDGEQLAGAVKEVLSLGEPTMLFLKDKSGSTLVVGIGSRETVLTFVESDGTSFHSVGDTNRGGVLKFWCRDQVDDFLAEMAVPTASGIDAAKSFVATRQRPTNIRWEADW